MSLQIVKAGALVKGVERQTIALECPPKNTYPQLCRTPIKRWERADDLIFKMDKILSRYFTKQCIYMASKHIKNAQLYWLLKKCKLNPQSSTDTHPPEWLKLKISNVGESVEQLEFVSFSCGSINW